ncbi:MAG: dephospho-CoA kinase [bacterium]|nr:dephospho-CoA kinase [bacterium]
MIRVGITGGIGTGKATVAAMFGRRGAIVIDADELARAAVRPGTAARRRVVDAFGDGVVGPDGALRRRRIARIVFRRPDRLAVLNAIVHPPVVREMRRRLRAARGAPAAVVNVPLLFEAGLGGEFDAVVVVTCPREEQIRRARARDGLSRRAVEARIRAQMPLEEKAARADYVIDNGGPLRETERQVGRVWRGITGSGARRGRARRGRPA